MSPKKPSDNSELKKKALLKALIEGEKSGYVKNFDPEAHLKSLHKRFIK